MVGTAQDITARRRIARELHNTTAQDRASDTVWDTSRDTSAKCPRESQRVPESPCRESWKQLAKHWLTIRN